jgi:MerR family redox-sensitive transcriptional activator SoxR
MASSAGLTIGQVANQAGIRTSKIRYYETVGLLNAVPRVSGRRVYEREVLDTLRLIAFAKDAGFTIDEIRHVLSGFDRRTPASARWQAMARRKLEDVGALMERAERMQRILETLLTCQCVQLSECASLCGTTPMPVSSLRKNRK